LKFLRDDYLSCGGGYVDVLKQEDAYSTEKKIASRPRARTALFIPELTELIIASPSRANVEAALLIYAIE
jgi:hypothetical protein